MINVCYIEFCLFLSSPTACLLRTEKALTVFLKWFAQSRGSLRFLDEFFWWIFVNLFNEGFDEVFNESFDNFLTNFLTKFIWLILLTSFFDNYFLMIFFEKIFDKIIDKFFDDFFWQMLWPIIFYPLQGLGLEYLWSCFLWILIICTSWFWCQNT